MIYNNAVDEKVLTYYDDPETLRESTGTPSYNESVLTTQIGNLNRIATSQDFKRLMSHNLIEPDSITKLLAQGKAKHIADNITKAEVERTLKNLDYIEKTLNEVELRVDTYKELIKKLPKKTSRLDILNKAKETGVMLDGRKVRDLDKLAEALEDYKQNHMKYENALLENNQASREGYDPLKTKKVWVWSKLERTRHLGMDGVTVDLYDKFTVVNDITHEVDYLRFPRDIENDKHGCSNICNCGCSYEII